MGNRTSPETGLLSWLDRPECGLIAVGSLLMSALRVEITSALSRGEPREQADYRVPLLLASGLIVGAYLAFFQRHPRRCLGLVPPAATGAGLAATVLYLTGGQAPTPQAAAFLFGSCGGLIGLPLLLAALGAELEPGPVEELHLVGILRVVLLVLALPILPAVYPCSDCLTVTVAPNAAPWVLAHGFLVLALWSWALYYPHTLELLCELLLVPLYHLRLHGPGKDIIPRDGPLLLVANHSSYFDPFWVGKIVPRRVRPMMTSRFFDLPLVRWLMVYAVQAIRVQVTRVRREVPELQEALAVLRQDGCVLIFPEGRLRRKECQLLQPFGQGAWHLLKELPETPVLVLWIEGGWGSFLSYYQAPPGRNKWLDWGRRIDVALAVPRPIPAEVLADQRRTRRWLWRACLECRAHLGLPVPPAEIAESESQASRESPADSDTGDPHQIVL
jgi:1-acyl-sn-glycerol-3-phosphate acyltransferase